MKVKFNKLERIAGVFVLFAILGVAITGIVVAVEQGWFETKIIYSTYFENADGLHQGTLVQIAGLRAGAISEVELKSNKKVLVRFYVLKKFQNLIREDSYVQLIRPFIIGERVLDITVGSENLNILQDHQEMKSIETMDIVTLISGKNLNSSLLKISEMLENVKHLTESLLNRDRVESMVKIFDEMYPLISNMNRMSLEVTKLSKLLNTNDDLKVTVQQLAITTQEMNKILPALNANNPNLAENLAQMTQNLTQLSQDFRIIGSSLRSVESEMPKASQRFLQALDETVIVLKAMQKSFFMRSHVKEVLKEESQREPAANSP